MKERTIADWARPATMRTKENVRVSSRQTRLRQVAQTVVATALSLALPVRAQMPPADAPRASITESGAVGDGITLNTQGIQKTIDRLAVAGGGTVVVPQGVFLTGAIFLKPGVNLHLDRYAVLKGSTNVSDYPAMTTRIEGHFQAWLPALVNADQTDHLRITGEGTLDGSGKPFWDEFRRRIMADRTTKNLDVKRPRLILIQNSRDVLVSGIHLKDSGFWNLHL